MAKTRKDERGRALRKGEVQRASDKRYMYTYTDPLGRRRSIYAQDLATLREKEKQLMKDQLDGLDPVSYTHLDVYKRQLWRYWIKSRKSSLPYQVSVR